jgi:hypothetical protein
LLNAVRIREKCTKSSFTRVSLKIFWTTSSITRSEACFDQQPWPSLCILAFSSTCPLFSQP